MSLFPPEKLFTDSNKGHGRIETRTIQISSGNPKTHIPFISQSFKITRETSDLHGNNKRVETVYGITSLMSHQAKAEMLLKLNRGHWAIENSVHYVRDVTFDEDRSRIRKGSGPRIMATIRNLVISLLRILGFNNIAEGLRSFLWINPNDVIKLIKARI
jgi:predicted transposase YbfD/YdcC